MKYIKQLIIILLISFIGEILNYLIPLPVPASIYGIIIMFLCLCLGIVKVENVKQTADFLIEIMPIMFIPAAAGLINSFEILKPSLLQYIIITLVSTFVVMAAAGIVTQKVIDHSKKSAEAKK